MNHHESKPQREQQVTSLAGTFARTPEEVFVGHRSSGAPVAPCSNMKTENGVKSTIQTDPCDNKGHTHTRLPKGRRILLSAKPEG